MVSRAATQAIAAGLVLLALAASPASLLPPHRLAEAVQSMLGVNWKSAYLIAALSVQVLFYGSLGALATLALNRRHTLRGQLLQAAVVPWVVVGLAVLVRSIKLGHLPVLANAVVPVIACLAGVGLGLALRYRGQKTAVAITALIAGTALYAWLAAPSSDLAHATETHLRRLAATASGLPAGEARFGALVERPRFRP